MKTVSITVDDDVYAAVETEANKRRTSVSALVEGYLRALGQGRSVVRPDWSEEEGRKNREELVRLLRECKLELGYEAMPSPEERRRVLDKLWERIDACNVEVGERPTRARSYDHRRFHRY